MLTLLFTYLYLLSQLQSLLTANWMLQFCGVARDGRPVTIQWLPCRTCCIACLHHHSWQGCSQGIPWYGSLCLSPFIRVSGAALPRHHGASQQTLALQPRWLGSRGQCCRREKQMLRKSTNCLAECCLLRIWRLDLSTCQDVFLALSAWFCMEL